MTKAAWTLEDHCCATCYGRLISRKGDGEGAPRVFRCTNCGAESHGRVNGAPAGCACNLRVGKRNAGLRCVPNPDRSHTSPTEIIAMEVVG